MKYMSDAILFWYIHDTFGTSKLASALRICIFGYEQPSIPSLVAAAGEQKLQQLSDFYRQTYTTLEVDLDNFGWWPRQYRKMTLNIGRWPWQHQKMTSTTSEDNLDNIGGQHWQYQKMTWTTLEVDTSEDNLDNNRRWCRQQQQSIAAMNRFCSLLFNVALLRVVKGHGKFESRHQYYNPDIFEAFKMTEKFTPKQAKFLNLK